MWLGLEPNTRLFSKGTKHFRYPGQRLERLRAYKDVVAFDFFRPASTSSRLHESNCLLTVRCHPRPSPPRYREFKSKRRREQWNQGRATVKEASQIRLIPAVASTPHRTALGRCSCNVHGPTPTRPLIYTIDTSIVSASRRSLTMNSLA